MADISYKSYCWALGTTSFRTKNFNYNIELQLLFIDEFRKLTKNQNKTWQGLQIDYYYFLRDKGFVKGDAPRPDKDAREKTSGLVSLGLLTSEREITKAGQALLDISLKRDFASDNSLELPKDSYIYLKQLLKTSNMVDGKVVRPFVVFAYVESKLGYLTKDEFTYLLPLCTDMDTTNRIINNVKDYREGKITFDEILISVFMSMENYQAAFSLFNKNSVTKDLICTIGINRKSGSGGVERYDEKYYFVYDILKDIVINKQHQRAYELFEATKQISGKASAMWKKYLFTTTNAKAVKRDGYSAIQNSDILNVENIVQFNDLFFKRLHLYKMKATLSDYFDLNKRYFRLTDTVIFGYGKVEFDILSKCYFNNISDELIKIAFVDCDELNDDIPLENIDPCLAIDEVSLYNALGRTVGTDVSTAQQAKQVIKDERYQRLHNLIDEKFSKEQLIDLFTKFENRNDDEIRKAITDNADIPTMFEYVLGIAWYIISDKQGDILEYLNLSLEADLLPKTHAAGGEADIVYKYEKTPHYPEHTLLIEATLSEKNAQRRMEMEPVSRHLGDYLVLNSNKGAYCVFVSTYLHINVISDFRMRKNASYFSSDGSKSVRGMKIIPLQTSEIKTVLAKDIKYANLYQMFESAYNSSVGEAKWYDEDVVDKINQ